MNALIQSEIIDKLKDRKQVKELIEQPLQQLSGVKRTYEQVTQEVIEGIEQGKKRLKMY
jgi:hypothetical protein